MNLIELLNQKHGGDPDIVLFNLGILLGIIPKNTQFGTTGKELIYTRSTLTKLLTDIYQRLLESQAFYKDGDDTFKARNLNELYMMITDKTDTKTLEKVENHHFIHMDDMFMDKDNETAYIEHLYDIDEKPREKFKVIPLINDNYDDMVHFDFVVTPADATNIIEAVSHRITNYNMMIIDEMAKHGKEEIIEKYKKEIEYFENLVKQMTNERQTNTND